VSCAVVILVVSCSAAAPPSGDQLPALHGVRLQVVGSWSGVEQRHFVAVLHAFDTETGARVRYTYAHGYLPNELDARFAHGDPPDLAVFSQPGLLDRYARQGRLVPLDAATAATVRAGYAPVWRRLASWHGRMWGVWFKAANKSLVWYDIADFERLGLVGPTTLAGLVRTEAVLRHHGTVPLSLGAGGLDAWTLTDWFENVYLRLAGPAAYDALSRHEIAWTTPGVARTLVELRRLLAPHNLLGGTGGALRTGYENSVAKAFGRPPGAAMLMEGDFVASVISARTPDRLGTDVDVFPFPGDYRGEPVVMGGGDVVVQTRAARGGAELLRYLASPGAAAIWARAGGFISPNLDLDLGVYPDRLARAAARSVVEAGDRFRFDLSDLAPDRFGAAPTSGMQGALRRFLVTGNVRATQAVLEADARAAWP
jgi:ABC-type glycerol-3-phosphate transport system substrate-binding protein